MSKLKELQIEAREKATAVAKALNELIDEKVYTPDRNNNTGINTFFKRLLISGETEKGNEGFDIDEKGIDELVEEKFNKREL